MTCSASRLIILAFAVGLVTATVLGSDVLGWFAAGIAVAIAVAAGRLLPGRPDRSACAVPRPVVDTTTDRPAEGGRVAP